MSTEPLPEHLPYEQGTYKWKALGAAMGVACGTAIATEAFPVRALGRGLG